MSERDFHEGGVNRIQGRNMDWPLPTLAWPDSDPPASWWGRNERGELTKVYRSYADYCDD